MNGESLHLERINGELTVLGANAHMKLCLEKQARIERALTMTSSLKVLKVLNRAWWAEFFRIREVAQ